MNILFVCTGNTCRSPMAEALLRKKAPGVNTQSAGIFAGNNQRANHHTIMALKKEDIDLSHKTQPLSPRLLNWADLVLTMTTQHKQALMLQYPKYNETIFTLKEYVSEADKDIWEQLKKTYANYELKRSSFVHKNQHKYDNTILDQKIVEFLQTEIDEIQQLESNLSNHDISDPFGGDQSVYDNTLGEINTYVDMLVEKLYRTKN